MRKWIVIAIALILSLLTAGGTVQCDSGQSSDCRFFCFDGTTDANCQFFCFNGSGSSNCDFLCFD